MKTLVIYNDMMNELKFLIVDGDYSRFNNVCINSTGTGLEEEFADWFFNQETGAFKFELSSNVSLIEGKDWDKVAVCSFLP